MAFLILDLTEGGKERERKNVPNLYHLLKNKGQRVKVYSGTVSPNEHDQE